MKSPLSSRWRCYVLGAVAATSISMWGWKAEWRWGVMLDNVAHDVGFRLRTPLTPRQVAEDLPRSNRIVIIALPHGVPRHVLAEIIDRLGQAKAVALDLTLADRAADITADELDSYQVEIPQWRAEDKILADAIRRAGNVIIGAWPDRGTGKTIRWMRPAALFERNARALTHFQVSLDAQDGITRRLPLWENVPLLAPSTQRRLQNNLFVETSTTQGRGTTTSSTAIPAFGLQVAAMAQNTTPAQMAPDGKHDLWINFLGPSAALEDNAQWVLYQYALHKEPEDFKDKLVFIGETSFRSKDVLPTPEGDMPGVYIHAQATATLLDARGVPSELSWWDVAAMTLCASLLLVLPLPLLNRTRPLLFCALFAASEIVVLAMGVALLWAKWNIVAPFSAPAFAVFLTYNGIALVEYEWTRNLLGRVVGHTILGRLLDIRADPRLGGKEEVATALFCDLRGYSELARTLKPQQLISFLNSYTGSVVRVVEQFKGRPIDFFGDGVFVLFEGSDHARRAIEAAMALSELYGDDNAEGLHAGVALHSGPMVIGFVGHDNHLKPGAVGEAVNVAARVQTLSDECHHTVLITRQTLEEWQKEPIEHNRALPIRTVSCGPKRIKGYTEELEVFGLESLGNNVSQKID